jgi:hypothetical protein
MHKFKIITVLLIQLKAAAAIYLCNSRRREINFVGQSIFVKPVDYEPIKRIGGRKLSV